jgi:hypothetical protein
VDAETLKYANSLHLAYIKSPSTKVNNDSRLGMTSLVVEMIKRTSVEPEGTVELDIEKDELTLFPFIYWPITNKTPVLSEDAQEKVQNYINNGGVILFDLRDNSNNLSQILGNVSIKPLIPMDEEHTLTKTFYLTSGLPGSGSKSTIWVEKPDVEAEPNTSAVIIGQNNWAAAWAGKTLPEGSEEKENAIRSGINLIMFALTGTYKEDQNHIVSILERLEKDKKKPAQPAPNSPQK